MPAHSSSHSPSSTDVAGHLPPRQARGDRSRRYRPHNAGALDGHPRSPDAPIQPLAWRTQLIGQDKLDFFITDNGGSTQQINSRNDALRGYTDQVYEGGPGCPA